ncbi:MAG: sigma-70 family RNA polymerase sigma factor [Phycisphaeraceae bacterium]
MGSDAYRHSPDDVSQLALLWGKAQHAVSAYVHAAVRNHHDAEDVIQATVTYITRHFDEYDRDRPFQAWAIGIARYRIMDHRNRHKRDPLLLGDAALESLTDAMTRQASHSDERREALAHCMGRLKPEHRQVLSDRYYGESSRQEIAEKLGIKARSVSVLLRRIRAVLAECISARLKGGLS